MSLYGGDYGGPSSQVISHIAARDTTDPIGKFASNNSDNFSRSQWSDTPIQVDIQCVNGGDSGDSCTCAGIKENGSLNSAWSVTPYGALADTNTFTRTF